MKAIEIAVAVIAGLAIGYFGQRWALGRPPDKELVEQRIESGDLKITPGTKAVLIAALYAAAFLAIVGFALRVTGAFS